MPEQQRRTLRLSGDAQRPSKTADDRGRYTVLQEKGKRQNVPDAATIIKGLGDLMRVWELNRAHRAKMAAMGGSHEDRLRGLFGGGR